MRYTHGTCINIFIRIIDRVQELNHSMIAKVEFFIVSKFDYRSYCLPRQNKPAFPMWQDARHNPILVQRGVGAPQESTT
jgi:hypothetical protein